MNQRPAVPPPTPRLAFRKMTNADLDDVAALLGDPLMMRYYERPKTRAEAQAWIDWNQRLYREQGFGLWVVTLRSTGEFAGDCGLTPQSYDEEVDVEVGYRIRVALQGQGYATEAAAACRDFARDVLDIKRLIAIIHPDNVPSQRVAEKIGLAVERDTTFRTGVPIRVYAAAL